MAVRNPTARPQRAHRRPDLEGILGRFSDARSILECAVRSLEEWHEPTLGIGDETVCLRHGLRLIRTVYNELDLAVLALASAEAARRE